MGHRDFVVAAALVLVALRPLAASAHETDQYTLPVGREFADLRGHFSRMAYTAIAEAVDNTNRQIRQSLWNNQPTADTPPLQSPAYVVDQVWVQLFAAIPTNETFDAGLSSDAMRARYPGLVVAYRPDQHIYDDPLLLVDVTKVVRTFFRSSTVNVNGTLFGTDKFLHFMHMGRIYYSTYVVARLDGLSEEAANARAVQQSTGYNPFLSEIGLLGMVTTGIRSNGDLAANFAGLKFYRNLTEPVRIGKTWLPPMLVREGLYWRLDARVRPGSDFFAAFITPHFNEALNPNTYLPLVDTRVRVMLRARCADVLDWYRDERGLPRTREQFAAIAKELSTFYGEPYGHQDDGENTVSIATTCFEAGGSRGTASVSAGAGQAGTDAQAKPGLQRTTLQAAPAQSPGGDRFGRTELWWAARSGRLDAVERQLAQAANPNALDIDGESPLHAAARGGHVAVIEVLVARGADPRAKARNGTTPLHASVEAAQAGAAQALLQKGADANALDVFGKTPLHDAVLQGNRELAALLIDYGADRVAVYGGRTPAQLAARGGDEALAKWLNFYRPNPTARSGATPADDPPPRAYQRLPRVPAKPERRPGVPVS